jgi:hypothetical protein
MVAYVAPALWFQQYSLDHVRIDIMGFQKFQGRHRIRAELYRQALIDDVAAPYVAPFIVVHCVDPIHPSPPY